MTHAKQISIKGYNRRGTQKRLVLSNEKSNEIKLMLDGNEIHIDTHALVRALFTLEALGGEQQ